MKLLNIKTGLLVVLACISFSTFAQLNPMGSMYYFNPYLTNPAMAGTKAGLEVSGSYKAQWTNIEGGPKMQSLTGTYGIENNNAAFGVMLNNENAGVIRRTSFRGTFAYHLPIDFNETFIDFGLSAGINDEGINMNKVIGSSNDVTLGNFNNRKPNIDADFGIAFRTTNIKVEAALPNLKRLFERGEEATIMQSATYYAAASYKYDNDGNLFETIEGKLSVRGILNYRSIIDVGVTSQLFDEKFNLTAIYHSTNSLSLGAGARFMDKFSILALYTTNTSAMKSYSNGQFEVGLKYSFF